MTPLEIAAELAAEAVKLRAEGATHRPRSEGPEGAGLGPYELERAAVTIAGLVWRLEREKRRKAPPAAPAGLVHVLFGGAALCGFGRGLVPAAWPAGHQWVSRSPAGSFASATCKECLAADADLPRSMGPW